MKHLKRFVVFILLGLAPASIDAETITEIEAVHLLEAKAPGITITSCRLFDLEGCLFYEILGRHGADGLRGLVHAEAARVLSIQKNDQPFYQWDGIQVVGHRGNVKFTPENTIPAFQKAIELGCDLVEIDVRESRDGHLVVMHDAAVNRTTNGTGRIEDLTLQEIKQLDAGSWFSPEFADTRVPTLDEALEYMKGKILPDIDFKAGSPDKLIRALEKHGFLGKVTLYCGDWDMLAQTQKLTDRLYWRPTVPKGWIGLSILIDQFDPPIVNIDWEQFTERLIREVHLAGKKSFLNTMQHDTEWAMNRVINTLPDYIQSDHVDILMPMLRSKMYHQ